MALTVAERLKRPELVLFLPALMLGALWLGGSAGLAGAALVLPMIAIWVQRTGRVSEGVPVSDQVAAALDRALRDGAPTGSSTGCIVLQFDDSLHLCDRLGRTRQSEILAASISRLRGALRTNDRLYALEDGSLAVVLGPALRLDLEAMLRIAGRLQLVVQQPMQLHAGYVQQTCSVGFCPSRSLPGTAGAAILDAAQIAADEAMRHRPAALRAFTPDLAQARTARDTLRARFEQAVEAGQIRAYFQPQVSTDSGAVTGVEALARWHHPDRGVLGPAEFLPAIEGTELIDQLGEVMLDQGLAMLAASDALGLRIPSVSVNLTALDLADVQLPDRLRWALDRHGLAPPRLTVEVLESVVARPGDDSIAQVIGKLSDLGIGIDLDDFGTGNASITTIRRFALTRLKIDRSFVRGVDHDRDQQKFVTAVLALAEQLGLDTLAEGVETQGEHAMLAQLGCGHVQGYILARPMQGDDLMLWLRQHRDRLDRALRIGVGLGTAAAGQARRAAN
jgi:EAL domain-containing protein (putative c-di-GMP-specific phosphodiesterase class I)/GGDEF domain-containing protein